AGVVAALEAWTAVAEAGGPRAGALLFVAVPGEEDGGTGTLAAIRAGWGADMAIVTEPTARDHRPPEVIVAHGGALTFTLTVPGRSAHACKRLEGVSALEHYWTLHKAMRAAEAQLNAEETDPLLRALGLPYPTCVGRVGGGCWSSSVMDSLQAEVRVGVAVGEQVAEAEARFRQTIADAAATDPWLTQHPPQVERTGAAFASARLQPGHPLIDHVRIAAAEVFGASPPLAAAPYGCDMAMWSGPGHTPTLVYGPGDVTLAHAPDEWVSLSQTEAVARVLLNVSRRVCIPPCEVV
ncbi:MAG: M20/M25/M40 family metallo-hydrolase, partial [Myxococcota bacterium]